MSQNEATEIRFLIDSAIRAAAAEIGANPEGHLAAPRIALERVTTTGIGMNATNDLGATDRPILNAAVLGSGWSSLARLPEVAALADRLQLHETNSAGRAGGRARTVSPHFGLVSIHLLLYVGLIELDCRDFYNDFLDEQACSVSRWLEGRTTSFTASSLLLNVDVPGQDFVEFDETTWLRKLGCWERMALSGGSEPKLGHMDHLTPHEVRFAGWAAETACLPSTMVGPVEMLPATDEPNQRLEDLLSAIRLSVVGQVGLRNLTIWREPTHSPASGLSWIAPQTFISPLHPLVELGSSDIERIRATRRQLRARIPTRPGAPLRVAVSRFNDIYHHSRDEDRFLDCVISLEALLVPGRVGDTAHRFAERGSLLLGADPARREELYLKLRDAYGNRSGVTHGGKRIFHEDADALVPLARQAIDWFLHGAPSMTIEEITAKIDQYAVGRQDGETLTAFLERSTEAHSQSKPSHS